MSSAALALAAAAAASAQRLAVTEVGAGATVVGARHAFWGVELGIARRPGGQARFALAAAGGDYEGSVGMRLEATAQFLLKPAERSGTSPYGGLGIAFLGGASARGAGYVTALLGLEAAPGRSSGWYAELGVGGGVRAAAGRRWRRFPAWW